MKRVLPLLLALLLLASCSDEATPSPSMPELNSPSPSEAVASQRPHLDPVDVEGDSTIPIVSMPPTQIGDTVVEPVAPGDDLEQYSENIFAELGFKPEDVVVVDAYSTSVDLGYGAYYTIEQLPSNPQKISYYFEGNEMDYARVVEDVNKLLGTELSETDVLKVIAGTVSFAYGSNGEFVYLSATRTTFHAYIFV